MASAARADFVKEVEATSPELRFRNLDEFVVFIKPRILEILDCMDPGSVASLGSSDFTAIWKAFLRQYDCYGVAAAAATKERLLSATSFLADLLISTTASATYIGMDGDSDEIDAIDFVRD